MSSNQNSRIGATAKHRSRNRFPRSSDVFFDLCPDSQNSHYRESQRTDGRNRAQNEAGVQNLRSTGDRIPIQDSAAPLERPLEDVVRRNLPFQGSSIPQSPARNQKFHSRTSPMRNILCRPMRKGPASIILPRLVTTVSSRPPTVPIRN